MTLKLQVVNKYKHSLKPHEIIYAGRGSVWGNPEPLKDKSDTERNRVCDWYEEYFDAQLKIAGSPLNIAFREVYSRAAAGEAITFECFCKPKRCHCDHIVKRLNDYHTKNTTKTEEQPMSYTNSTDIRNEFTPAEYMLIHLANCMGYDKKTFEERIELGRGIYRDFQNEILTDKSIIEENAESPYQALQCIREITKVMNGEPTGLMVGLDATSSFLQIMAALSGCKNSAKACNMLDPNKRYDAYTVLTNIISEAMPHLNFTRKQGKDLMMKSLAYGSQAVPKELFPGEDEYNNYLGLMNQYFPGVMMIRQELTDMWDPNALYHTFTLPDGHVSHVPVKVRVEGSDARIEIAEVADYNNGRPKSVTYIHEQHTASTYATPILANTIQAIDAYLVRAVRQSLAEEGIELVTIHDAFRVHPNNAGALRYWYREHLARLCDMNFLEAIIKDYTGEEVEITQLNDLGKWVRQSRYCLS